MIVHDDRDFARRQGLPETIADGVIVTAWIEAKLRDLFGAGYLKGGRLMTKFVKPLFAGDSVTIKMTLKEKLADGPAIRINLDISCYNEKGELVTVAAGSGLSR